MEILKQVMDASSEELDSILSSMVGVPKAVLESELSKLNLQIKEVAATIPEKGNKGDKGDKGDKGNRGLDGLNGKDGSNGFDGRDGKDGVDGKQGENGKDGISVVSAYLDFDNSLVMELSDGTQLDVGQFNTPEALTNIIQTLKQSIDYDLTKATGVLPVIKGGTGTTTSTGTGNVVLNTSPTMSVTGTGFTLQDATDNTKQANFVLSSIPTATTYAYTLPNVSGTLAALNLAQTFSNPQTFSGNVIFSTGNFNVNGTVANIRAESQTTGVISLGGTAQTGAITLGQSTVNQTTNIQAGATASGSTKSILIGTGGLAGSTTNIIVGSTAGNGNLTLAEGTGTQTVNIANSITASGSIKTINIGSKGAAGSATRIYLGSTTNPTTSEIYLNGFVTFSTSIAQTPIAVASLPSGANAFAGDRNFVNNALAPTFGSTVVGGGSVNVPVYYDGTNWRVG